MLFSYEKVSYQGMGRLNLTGFSKWNKWIYVQKVMSYLTQNLQHCAEEKTIQRQRLLGTWGAGGRPAWLPGLNLSTGRFTPIRSYTTHSARVGPRQSPDSGSLTAVSAGVSAMTTVPCRSRTSTV